MSSLTRFDRQPNSFNVNKFGTANVNLTDGEIAKIAEVLFDNRPYFIEHCFKLRNPIYSETATYAYRSGC